MSLFFTKFNVKRIAAWSILLNMCIIVNANASNNLPRITRTDLTPQKIYSLAQDRNGKALGNIREYLNIKDENGNTALCLAQQNKDKESFKILLVFGASKDVDCYDDTDPICAVIVGEKLKVRGAGWLLGAAAAGGAIYGASELLDNKKCPSGYSAQYQSVADCGKTGAEGWIYDWNKKDEKGKLCGRCTPKSYDTGCTTLWQSVNDCGKHPEGWNFESSGYAGDEVCGICTPKQCVNRDSTTVRGENIRYTDIEYCPHRDYMRPISQEQKGWSGVHGCYICNYACDEKNGFAQNANCEKNTDGHTAYNCAKDSDTQCYYRTTPKACPITDTVTTRGSSTAYSTAGNCPFRKYMTAVSVSAGSWSGEGQCYTCNYSCDGIYGFTSETACKTNESGGEGYLCQLDPNTQCYYRSKTPTPDNPTNPEKECPTVDTTTTKGASTFYNSKDACPFRKFMIADSVTPNGWSGEGQCYNCNYKCDEENGFTSETTCKTNKEGGEGYLCQLDPNTQCYYRSKTPTPDNPTNPEKECPSEYSTAYQSQSNCAIIGGTPDGWTWSQNGWSGELKCGKCDALTCPANTVSESNKDVANCPTVLYKKAYAFKLESYSGTEACYSCLYNCDNAQDAYDTDNACKLAPDYGCELIDGCYIVSDGCTEGSTRYQSVSDCGSAGARGWTFQWGGTGKNGKRCGICTPLQCPQEPTSETECGSTGNKGWEIVNSTTNFTGDQPCKICAAKQCPSYEEAGGCSPGTYEIATSAPTENYQGEIQCYSCDYTCYNSYSSQSACNTAASSTQYCKSTRYNITCWYPVEYSCPAGYTAGLKVEDCDTYKNGHYFEQTIVVPDSENSKGLDSSGNVADCYKCGFNCTGEHDGEPLVSEKSALGYVYFEVWGDPKCYLQKLPGNGSYGQCIDQDGKIGSAYPKSYISAEGCPKIQDAPSTTNSSWQEAELVGFYYAGEQCYLCANNPCSNQKTGTDTQCNQTGFTKGEIDATITSGSTACYTCNCDTNSGYYDSESDVPDCAGNIRSVNNYNGKECYYCVSASSKSLLSNDTANNQTLIIHHTQGDYLGETNINASATAPITDELTGETIGGDAIGSITVYNSASNAEVTLQAGGNRAVFNAKADGTDAENTISAQGSLKLIMEEGAENTVGAGMTTDRNAYNAYAEGNSKASGVIDVEDTKAATNVIYGIMARRNAYNAVANGEQAQAGGTININTATDKQAYGMYAGKDVYNQSTQNQTSIVNVTGTGKGNLYGLYTEEGSVYNSGNVTVRAANGNAYGIYVANGEGQVVDNSGNIIVASDTKTAYGIYVENAGTGMTLINSGLIDATGDENSRGIKVAENGQNAIVTNTGRIIVNGAENANNSAIDLNGGTLANAGEIEFIGAQNLDDLNGKSTLEKGGSYKADALSGSLKIGKSVVMEGFEDKYIQENAINAEDINGLEVASESAMFKGSVEKNSQNSYDAVATRRNFNEFAFNSSVAEYLEENYKRQRMTELFMLLKSNETDLELSQNILSETGADFLINIPAENLAALRNASEVIAQSALSTTDEENRIMSGADSYIINANGRRGATGYDTTAATAFMYGDKRLDNKNRLGLGLSFMQMSTSYDNGVDRKENFVSIFIPWIHKFSDKLRLASVFTAGYGYGEYDRGSDREADIQDIIYGITNKLVYEVNLADIAELEPALVLNAIGYYQDEMDDGTLTVKSGNHLSVEAGIGLYIKKELMDSKYGKLTARLGGMYYHELANPYNKMRAGFNGGVGSFEINDFANIYSRDRAVLSAMLDYEYKRLALYLKYYHMLQRNKSENFDMGIRYNF